MNDKYRTQLYLDEAQYLFLKESAAKYNTSIAGVVRALIDKEMGGRELVDEHDPLFRIATTPVTTGREDGSSDHDRYLYGSRPVRSSRRGAPPQKGESAR
ncbi:MAG TPA: hypothetical protein GXX28_03820 [Firmicutes bacterium]|nr:hypothetical protein [Bacillota bacterium]